MVESQSLGLWDLGHRGKPSPERFKLGISWSCMKIDEGAVHEYSMVASTASKENLGRIHFSPPSSLAKAELATVKQP